MLRRLLVAIATVCTFYQGYSQVGFPGSVTMDNIKKQCDLVSSNQIHYVDIYEHSDSIMPADEGSYIQRKEFDRSGKLILEICLRYDCPVDSMKTVYEYDENGFLNKVTYYVDPEYPTIQNYAFNDQGKLLEESTQSGESRKYSFKYTKSGLIAEKKGQCYEPGDGEEYKWSDCETFSYKYDSNNLLTEIVWMYVPGWGIPRKLQMTYNEKMQLVSETRYVIGESKNEWNLESKTDYSYNDKGLIIKAHIKSEENGDIWQRYQYEKY